MWIFDFFKKKKNVKEKTIQEPKSPKQEKKESFIETEIEQKISPSSELKTNFKISENWYGQGKKIRVEFNGGIHQHYSFLYDHDDVYEKTLNHLKTLSCWSNYGYYSSSTNIPSWAKDYIKQVNRYN